MLFNSIDFGFFLPVVFLLYWFVFNRNLKLQNSFIVIASYFFYGWWDWRFLILIFFSSMVDFTIGIRLSKAHTPAARKSYLLLSLFINLGLLGFFKYYNFFLDNFIAAFKIFGYSFNPDRLNIILPVGISFYTFQTLSYTIDVYRNNLKPTKDIISFMAFVSFFPQLVAGPIERASNLLPQFFKNRNFNYANAVNGLRQMLWGFFKKVVIADNCAEIANLYFNDYQESSGIELIVGAVFFAFQIYGDFSGYSDIAIGTSRLFGFNLMKNFAFPYFSRDIAEFWRRWHISLSTWFRDYLYIPLGGSKGTLTKSIRNTFIIFIVSGFWHGANWTFIAWGAINALYFLPLLITNKNRKNLNYAAAGRLFANFKEIRQILFTFMLTCLAWIFFRADSLHHAYSYIRAIFFNLSLTPHFKLKFYFCLLLLIFFVIVEWLGRSNEYAIQHTFANNHKIVRWTFYYFLIIAIMVLAGKQQEFIYFQF